MSGRKVILVVWIAGILTALALAGTIFYIRRHPLSPKRVEREMASPLPVSHSAGA